ncbi:protein Z-dependent protease inhibitor [Pelodytes ibericus]
MRWGLPLLLLAGLCLGSLAKKGRGRKEKLPQIIEELNQVTNVTLEVESLQNNTEVAKELSVHNVSGMNANFGFNLYRKMAEKHDDNILFSPFSVSYSLASLMLGTRGSTQDQLLEGLNLDRFKDHENPYLLPSLFRQTKEKISNSDAFLLDTGSFSFVHETFPVKEDYLNLTRDYFKMEYQTIDFHGKNAKNIINDYVNKKTRGKINKLYDEVDPQSKLILLDYILFKGKWRYPFNPELTEISPFFIDQYNSVKVPMMYKADKIQSLVDKKLSCTVFKIPYLGSAHMLVVMPENEGDMVTLEDHLSIELVDSWLAQMKSRKMDLFFPKFKLDQKYSLRTSLEDLGMHEIFTGRANLTELTEERNLKLSEVTQSSVIEVDEKGTEAATVTGSEITAYLLPPVIRVNRPFLFMIMEESYKVLLFIGRVVDPTKF